MRILVIGGTNFIGLHAVRQLHALGHEITVFHRGQKEPDIPADIRHLHHENTQLGDRSFYPQFQAEFERLKPEVVLDMIPMTEAAAQTLMDTFQGIARRVVAISSVDVYRAFGRLNGTEPGPPDPQPLTEDSPLREKLYPYRGDTPKAEDDPRRWTDDYDKILVEKVVMGDPQLPGTILRLPAVYGPGDYQRRLYSYVKPMDDGRPAILIETGWAQWSWSRGYVENVAKAITLAVTDDRAAGRIYNVAEPEVLTEKEWAEAIGRAAGWKGEVVTLTKAEVDFPDEQLPESLKAEGDTRQHLRVDTSRIRRELGYTEDVPLPEALRRTIEWDRACPPDPIDPKDFNYAAEDAVLAHIGERKTEV